MALPRKFFVLIACWLAVVSLARGVDPETRTMLPESIKTVQASRTRTVAPLRKEHLGKQIEFQIALRMRDFPKLLARLGTGEFVSSEEMAARYLPLPADYQAVIDWARREGLTITQTDPLRLGLFVKGTVAQIQTATQAQFAEVTVPEGTFTSAISAPSVPTSIAPAVLGLDGLQPHIHPHHASSGLQPQIANEPPYLVKEIMGAYDATALGYDGTGETIAILIDTFPSSSDLTSFWSYNGIPQNLSNIDKIQAVAGTLDPVSGEETLDSEWTSGIASGANIRIYATTDLSFTDLDKGLQRIIADLPNQPSMHELSISLGLGETDVSSSQKQTDSQYFATIANSGVSIFVSSGDDGSVTDDALQPSYYSSDPSVTGVGGTSLDLYGSGSVESETGWNGSGGGVSSFFQRPAWQVGEGVPAGTMREVPDVASVADPNTGAFVFLQGQEQQIGGTSWAAPTWAGFCALINEARTQNGLGPIGMLNPKIYPLIGSSSFRDITSGNNGAYQATPGYDRVTGIGTPMVGSLLTALTGNGSTAPLITSFSPVAGAVGNTVTINGVNLGGVTGVQFNGTPAQFTPGSSISLTATVPTGAATGPITVVSGTASASSASSFTVVPLPTNDDFADATVISGTQGSVMGSNIGATTENGEPTVIDGSPSGASVWWTWQSPDNGTYTFSTGGSTFDTTEAVFTGTSAGDLTTIASNDDNGTSVTSSVTFTATAGTIYYVYVGGYQGAAGAIDLSWAENVPVPVITSFTPQSGLPNTVVTVTGAYFTGVSKVTVGGSSAAFSTVTDSQLTFTVPPGAQTGPIAVSNGLGTSVSSANFVVVQPVVNDQFINAIQIQGGVGSVIGSNVGATKQPNEPNIAGNAGGASIWYYWIPASSAPVTFTTFGSSFNTLLGVFTGDQVGSLTPVAENDDYGNTVISSVTFYANAGTIYRIAVDGYNGDSGNVALSWSTNSSLPLITGFSPSSGPVGTTLVISGSDFTGATSASLGSSPLDFTVVSDSEITALVPAGAQSGLVSVGNLLGSANSSNAFTVTAGPSNDDFANSTPLTGSTIHTTGANVGATKETGEPDIAGNPGGASVWWSWTAPGNGVFAVSTQGSNFDTLLGVFNGNAVDALTEVAENDDDPAGGVTSYVIITATAGDVYRIAVDGLNGATGSIGLSVYPQQASLGLYSTGFEAKQGFTAGSPLAGQDGWQTVGSGGNGIVAGYDGMSGQQAYIGFTQPSGTDDPGVRAFEPVNYSPVGSAEPIVTFSTTMAINDSTNLQYDDFQWQLYNSEGHNLFTIDFANENLQVYYGLDGGKSLIPTGVQFADNTPMRLVVTMDYSRNLWSATLNGSPLVKDKPIHTGSDLLDFGNMSAVWKLYNPDDPGNDYMLFDDYTVIAGQDPAPRITFQPEPQTVLTGNSATLGVVASGQAPLYYQWLLNKKPLTGQEAASLTIADAQAANAGSYTVEVSNAVGLVTSSPAILTVNPTPSAPEITQEPASQTVAAGSTAIFQTAASGYPVPAFQWLFEGNPIAGATRTTLEVRNAQTANHGAYTVIASNLYGSGTSAAATLAIGNSFRSEKGNFSGMIFNGQGDVTGSGLMKITMGAGGSFTGTVTIADKTYRLAGSFNSEGLWQGIVGHVEGAPITVSLQLSLSGTNEIIGSFTEGATTETSTAARDNYSKGGVAAPELPSYTMTLTGTAAGLPEGVGYASVTVDAGGNVRAAGRLGDNTPFTLSSQLSDTGAWPFFLTLYKSTGYIGGTLDFDLSSQPALDGTLNWVRPGNSASGGYPAGFSGDLTATGYRYTPPAKGEAAIPLNGEHQGLITFSGSILPNPVVNELFLSPANALTTSGTSGIKFSLARSSGIFSGTVDAGFVKPLPFYGVLLQPLDQGAGFLQTKTVSGTVEITSP